MFWFVVVVDTASLYLGLATPYMIVYVLGKVKGFASREITLHLSSPADKTTQLVRITKNGLF